MDNKPRTVTLEAFASRVGCHFTTASRLRAGLRRPGEELLGKIVGTYELNPAEAFHAYTTSKEAFGAFLRDNIFCAPVEPADTEDES